MDKWDKLRPGQHEEDVAPSLCPLCSTREPQALCSEWFPVQGEMEGLERDQQMLPAAWGWERGGLGSPSILQVRWGQSQALSVGHDWCPQRTRDIHCSSRLGSRIDIFSWGGGTAVGLRWMSPSFQAGSSHG